MLRHCGCLRLDGRLLPLAAIVPSGSTTDPFYAHPRCFAAAMGNCSKTISREHYISHGIYRQIEKTYTPGDRLKVGGLPWQPPSGLQEVSSERLTSKVLCKKHNEALSVLDSVGVSFFRAFHQIHDELPGNPNPRRHYLFNGHDIERWMLKTICGVIASGSTTNIPKTARPPREYLESLFEGEKFPATWGLYLLTDPGERKASGGLSLATLSDGRIVKGLMINIFAFTIILALHAVSERSGLLAHSVNRPDSLHFRHEESQKESTILLGWEMAGDGGTVEIVTGPGE